MSDDYNAVNRSYPNLQKPISSKTHKSAQSNKTVTQVRIPVGSGLIKLVKCLPEESTTDCTSIINDFIERTRAHSQAKEQKMAQLRKSAIFNQNKECTFRPKVHAYNTTLESVDRRLYDIQVIEKKRKEKEEREKESTRKDMKECTFKPKINQYLPNKSRMSDLTNYGLNFANSTGKVNLTKDIQIPQTQRTSYQNTVAQNSIASTTTNLQFPHQQTCSNFIKRQYDFMLKKQAKLKLAEKANEIKCYPLINKRSAIIAAFSSRPRLNNYTAMSKKDAVNEPGVNITVIPKLKENISSCFQRAKKCKS